MALHLHPVTILAFNYLIIASAEDYCPREINTIFFKPSHLNDLNDLNDQKNLKEKLNITNFKPDPPEISKLYDGNILGKSKVKQKFLISRQFQSVGPLQHNGLGVTTFCSCWNF